MSTEPGSLGAEAARSPTTDRARLRELRHLLQASTAGGALPDILARVIAWIERESPGSLGSVLLKESDGARLRHAAAPSLPPDFCRVFASVPIGPAEGSCGTAAHTGQPVIVADIRTSPLWEKYQDAVAPFGLRACWSHPIVSSSAQVLGTFAIYRREPGPPSADAWDALVDAAHIAALLVERAWADQESLKHEVDLRAILDHAMDIIVRLDPDGGIVYANPAMARLFGRTEAPRTSRAMPTPEWPPELRLRLAAACTSAVANRAPHRAEFAVEAAEGERWLESVTVPEFAADGALRGFVVIARDSTARRRADLALRRSEERLRQMFNLSGRSIAILDTSGRLTDVGDVAITQTGLDRTHVLGARFWELPTFDGLLETQDVLRRAIREAAAGRIASGETTFRGPDGQLRSGWFSVVPVRDADHRVVELLMEGGDTTETKELEQRVRQAEKMESLGRLAGGIAHDFNNILAAILGYGELLLSDAAPGTEAYEGLQHIVHSSRRARDLVKQILAFSRKAELIHQPVDLRAVVVDGLRLLRASLPSTIELRERIAPGPLVVLGDASQLSQVLLNLGSNAEYVLRALGDGRLEVELERVQLDQDWARAIGLPMGAHARLVVRDSGRGIPTEVISKVFEPFFTTKPVGEGTGMGLAVVHGIVVAHGGAVRLDSSSRGTTFECFFPLVSTPVTVAVQREGESLRGSGRVLAVDDEQAIVNLLQRVLPRRGFEVVCLTSPVEALERFRAGPHDFDIVISDRTMPRMTGYALAAELHAIRPELPVIITSGQGGGPIDDEVEARAIFHLAKPFDVADLMRVIERARRGERLDDRA
jgi:PAS domain S-box-containing protein